MIRTILICLLAVSYRPIELDKSYNHDKWDIQPKDIIKNFRAYTVSFDSSDDDISTGLPEWVAYQIKPGKDPGAGPERPSKWISEKGTPTDGSYRGSGFDRGHMCPKFTAWRLGANADWNTHTVLNACPQHPNFNRGIWLDMEKKCVEWAKTDSVYVITGPVIYDIEWIGDKGEIPIVVPGAFYKIIYHKGKLLALLYPHHNDYKQKGPHNHSRYLVSVDYIELLTGLDFFTTLPDDIEKRLERSRARRLWGEGIREYKK